MSQYTRPSECTQCVPVETLTSDSEVSWTIETTCPNNPGRASIMNTNAHGVHAGSTKRVGSITTGHHSYGTNPKRAYAHVGPEIYSDGPDRRPSTVHTVRMASAHTRTLGQVQVRTVRMPA